MATMEKGDRSKEFSTVSATTILLVCSIVGKKLAFRLWSSIVMDSPPNHDERLRKLSDESVCPNCGKTIASSSRQVYGGGVFCSLQCVAEYNAAELVERHRRIVAALERHRRS
jgi:hypothetical protein